MPSTISAGTTAGTAIAIAGDTTGNLAFQTNGTTTAMTITTSQNVGIGNTNPTGNLHIGNGSTSGDQNLYVQSDAANRPRARLWSGTTSKLELSVGSTAEINAVTNTPMTFFTNNTEQMRIATGGQITMTSQPRFDASATANGSGSGEWGAAWAWNININVGSHFNANGRFTAPVAGTYLFYIESNPPSSGNPARSRIRKNGADIYAFNGAGARQIRSDTNTESIWGLWMVQLAAGDYVSGYSDQPASRESAYSTIGGYLLG